MLVLAPVDALALVNATSTVRGSDSSTRITWVTVSLSNPMSRPLEGRLVFTSYGYRSGQSTAYVDLAPLPPGASRTLNIALPLDKVNSGSMREANGDVTNLNLHSAYHYHADSRPMYLFVSDSAQRPTDDEMDEFTYRILPGDPSLTYRHMSSGSATTTRSLSPAERIVTYTPPAELPENWLCYMPIQAVIMHESVDRRLTAPQRQALDTWIEAGGDLLVFGGPESSSKSEDRLHGRIQRTAVNPLDPEFKMPVEETPLAVSQRLIEISMPYSETTAGGRGGAFALATLFLIIVGPVNYFYYLKRGEIRRLIVTVPLISVAFCSLIAVYFVFTQGFNRKGGSISLTTVNEDTNRAMTFARHSLLTGLYPVKGFRFNSQTLFLPRLSDNYDAAWFDLTRERVLEKGMFQPGVTFEYATMTPYTTRERVLFDAEKSTVRNGYELPVKRVAVFHNGEYYSGGAAAPGAEVAVKAVDKADLLQASTGYGGYLGALRLVHLVGQQALKTDELNSLENMANYTVGPMSSTTGTLYAAIFDGVPKTSDAGVEISDGKNLHIVLGKTAPAEVQP